MEAEKLFFSMLEYEAGNAKRIQHFIKVHSLALRIGIAEGLDEETLFLLEAAALVHDIGIKPSEEKYGSGAGQYQEAEGPPLARAMLERLQYPKAVIDRVCYLVGRHHTYSKIDGIDYQILVEADFLVNMFEGGVEGSEIRSVYKNIFRTAAGKRICEMMFREAFSV